MQLLSQLFEISHETSLTAIRDELYQLKVVVRRALEQLADKVHQDQNGKTASKLFKGSLAKWFSGHYLNNLEPALRDLHNQSINAALSHVMLVADRAVRDELELSNFANLMQVLKALAAMKAGDSASIGGEVASMASELIASIDGAYDLIQRVKRAGTAKVQVQPQQSKPKPDFSKQAQAAEQLINQVLSSLDRTTAAEIRAAIAKKPNKLAAIQQELVKRGLA